MKNIVSILLILSMLLSFAACSSSADADKPSGETTAQSHQETTYADIEYEADDLPDSLNFDSTVNILSYDGSGDSSYRPEISVEELTSEVVNDSIYNREKFVEDRLGVEINNFGVSDTRAEIDKQLNSGDDSHQIFAIDGISLSRVSMNNYFIDLHSVEYLNLDKPWWFDLYNDEVEVLGNLYFASGSLSLDLLRDLYIVYFNKAIADDYGDKKAELLDLYSLVNDGKWTLDKFIELSEDIYQDLNGNSTRDTEDLYGIGYVKTIPCDAIWGSFDINVFSKTSDGWFELDVNTEKLYKVLEKMNNLFYNVEGCFAPTTDECTLSNMNTLFASGTILFMVHKMESVEKDTLRNMQDEYGILPYPKYDENQKEYYSCASDAPTSFAIPTTNNSPEIAGAVLEALASYSYRDTYPAYLDTALKGKYMSDPESRKMIDLVVDGYKLDASWVYFDTLAQEYPAMYRYMLIENETNYASSHASRSKSVERTLKIYKTMFEDIA